MHVKVGGGTLPGRSAILRTPYVPLCVAPVPVIALIALLPLSFGAGGFAFPVLILAPLAVARERWNRWIRIGLAVPSLGVGISVSVTFFSELTVMRAAIGTLWFGLVYAGLVWSVCFSLASRHDPRFGGVDTPASDLQTSR